MKKLITALIFLIVLAGCSAKVIKPSDYSGEYSVQRCKDFHAPWISETVTVRATETEFEFVEPPPAGTFERNTETDCHGVACYDFRSFQITLLAEKQSPAPGEPRVLTFELSDETDYCVSRAYKLD